MFQRIKKFRNIARIAQRVVENAPAIKAGIEGIRKVVDFPWHDKKSPLNVDLEGFGSREEPKIKSTLERLRNIGEDPLLYKNIKIQMLEQLIQYQKWDLKLLKQRSDFYFKMLKSTNRLSKFLFLLIILNALFSALSFYMRFWK